MGVVADALEDAVDFIGDVISDIGDAISDVIEFVSDVVKDVVNISMTVTGIKWLDEQLTGGLLYNTITGTIDNLAGILQGAVTGDWVLFRNSLMGTFTTAMAVAAIIVGSLTGQYWAVAAGVTVLDAQHNEGELLRRTIAITGSIETAIFNTNYIEQYAEEIQMLITVAASLYAGYTVAPYLPDISQVLGLNQQWASQIATLRYYAGMGYGAYQIYGAVSAIIASQEYWKEQLRLAEEYYRNLIRQVTMARDMWFEMMTNTDMINRILPGGDLYVMGSGHDLFSITSVAEPRYALGLIDRSDPEMDKTVNNRYYAQYPGSDAYKPN